MKWELLIVFGLLAVIGVSGCTQIWQVTNEPTCEPNYVNLPSSYYPDSPYIGEMPASTIRDDICKSACYEFAKVTSYKIDYSGCVCDVNNCRDVITSGCGDSVCSNDESCESCANDCGLCTTKATANRICVDARVLLRKAEYFQQDKTLEATIYNYGKVNLRLKATLTYPDGVVEHPTTLDINAGVIDTFSIDNVESDLTEITIKSIECEPPCYECIAAQDFRPYIDIKGIGY